MSETVLRRAAAADLDRVAAFVAAWNARPESRCLMVPETAKDVRGDMKILPGPPERHFVLAEAGGELVGVAAADWDREENRGWVMGPFTDPARWESLAPRLMEALLASLPPEVRWLDTYTDLANTRAYTLYRASGFLDHKRAEVWEAKRPAENVVAGFPAGTALPPDHEPAFLALHDLAFPATHEPGPRLLAYRDAEHAVFAAAAGDGTFAGYIAVKIDDAPRQGFVDYLAVAPSARQQGHGRRLLQTALRWAFLEHGVSKTGLILENQNLGARALYESSGFRLLSSGISTRKQW